MTLLVDPDRLSLRERPEPDAGQLAAIAAAVQLAWPRPAPPDDAEILRGKGVASVYTPKDYSFEQIMEDLVGLVERQRDGATP